MIPSLFRTELWHPLSVHFPIGLLIVGTLLRTVSFTANPFVGATSGWRRLFFESGQLLTVIGALASWVSWYTGNLAEEEVNSKLCDPTLTHLHGDLAFYVTLIFSAVALIDIASHCLRARSIPSLSFLNSQTVALFLVLLALGGSGLLAYVGHLGAGLTYNQAAGVYVPSAQCTEYAE